MQACFKALACLIEGTCTHYHAPETRCCDDPCLIIFSDWPKYKLQPIADIRSAPNGNPKTAKVLNMPFEPAPCLDLIWWVLLMDWYV